MFMGNAFNGNRLIDKFQIIWLTKSSAIQKCLPRQLNYETIYIDAPRSRCCIIWMVVSSVWQETSTWVIEMWFTLICTPRSTVVLICGMEGKNWHANRICWTENDQQIRSIRYHFNWFRHNKSDDIYSRMQSVVRTFTCSGCIVCCNEYWPCI